jgi:hypothetical protein
MPRDGFDGTPPVQLTMTPGPSSDYPRSTSSSKRQNSAGYFDRSERASPNPSNTNGSGSSPWLNNAQAQEEPITGEIDTVGLGPKPPKMPDAEWKRLELQMRVDRARVNMPQSVKLRLFMRPEECVEAFEVLDWINKKDTKPDPNATIMASQTPLTNSQSDFKGNLVDV